MPDESTPASRRRPWTKGPCPGASPRSWLALDDDGLLARIETLPDQHTSDKDLLEVVSSDRHFFIRQEAAKRLVDHERLKEYRHDRHIGQILVRRLGRDQDAEYLEELVRESRFLEVRRAASAQLEQLRVHLQARTQAQPSASE